MTRRRRLPYLIVPMFVVLLLAWWVVGGVFAVVLAIIFSTGTILALVPLSPRRSKGNTSHRR